MLIRRIEERDGGERHALASQAAMTAVALGFALALMVYLAVHGAPAGDEAGRPELPAAAQPVVRGVPAVLRSAADPDVAYLFVVATENERVALVERLATEHAIRDLLGEKRRTAWVAVAADDVEQELLAATMRDQEGVSGQRVVLVSLRTR